MDLNLKELIEQDAELRAEISELDFNIEQKILELEELKTTAEKILEKINKLKCGQLPPEKKVFEDFLKNHGIFKIFMENIEKQDLFVSALPATWIINAFTWEYSEQGCSFWDKYNELWLNELEKM